MLKKTIIAIAVAGTAMMALTGGANAGKGHGFKAAPKHFAGKVAPHKFKIAGKRKFRHGRHFGYHNGWYYRPNYRCHWLKRKARWTGSRYWWKRYNRCRFHYGYYY